MTIVDNRIFLISSISRLKNDCLRTSTKIIRISQPKFNIFTKKLRHDRFWKKLLMPLNQILNQIQHTKKYENEMLDIYTEDDAIYSN